ncbi:MAG TPA: iron ABC transporter substrate-binding protein [Eggerthellaceae bacterium]|nr:iron ABC transporter substrate-binding protein [Eggerthellaceae bacterium]
MAAVALFVAGCSPTSVGAISSSASTSASAGAAASASAGAVASEESATTVQVADFHNADLGNGWQPERTMPLQYATCFSVDYYAGGYKLFCLSDGGRYLTVPEGAQVPQGIDDDIVVVQQPLGDIYLVASDTMCLFDALDALDRITVSGISKENWHIPSAVQAMDAGTIAYGGKYSAPDYELLLGKQVRLAIESTMINHTPEVRDKLEEVGIPVLVEMSSYESEPLGRTEWVKFYGAMMNEEDRAQALFDEQVAQVAGIDNTDTGKRVAFFYINSNGAAVVRKPGDYVTKMLDQAGGSYIFDSLDEAEGSTSSVTLEMERFYAMAKDADVIIYNSSIDSSVASADDLLRKNPLLADFKAVQDGNLWITDQNMYQQMMQTGRIIADFNAAVTGSGAPTTYVHKLG